MLQMKQKQQQHFNMYSQMQQFSRAPSAPILSQMPPTRSQMAPLLALPNQQPRFHPDHLSSGPRMPHRPTMGPPPPPAFGIGPCSGPRSLLGPKPMLQQSVVIPQMPGMPGGHRKQVPASFLPVGVRPSLLGPAPISAPIGAPLRNTNLGFFPRQHRPHGPFNNNVSAYTPAQRKRENGYIPAGRTNVQINRSKPNIQAVKVEKKAEQAAKENMVSSLDQTEPPVKKQKNQGVKETGEADQGSADADSSMLLEQEDEELRSVDAERDVEQGRTAEVQVVGSSLKVTIQRSSDSRAFSTGLEEIAAAVGQSMDNEKSKTACKFFCYICSITCADQPHFQTHMISLDHQQKMMEIQHLSNTCLATLIPQMQQSLQGSNREKSQDQQRWCDICQNHFTGDVIEHRRTKQHKMAKVSSRPFCTVCERHFRTPRKFVEHMKSPEHKQRVEELKEERGPEVMEELITVDAIGCFEGEDDYEEDNEDEEEDAVSQQLPEEMNDSKEYDPETQYGTRFVVPVAGFLCKLCHKFYHFESSARETHCKSLVHYQNLQKYKAMLNQPQEDEESMATSPWLNPKNINDCDADMEDKS